MFAYKQNKSKYITEEDQFAIFTRSSTLTNSQILSITRKQIKNYPLGINYFKTFCGTKWLHHEITEGMFNAFLDLKGHDLSQHLAQAFQVQDTRFIELFLEIFGEPQFFRLQLFPTYDNFMFMVNYNKKLIDMEFMRTYDPNIIKIILKSYPNYKPIPVTDIATYCKNIQYIDYLMTKFKDYINFKNCMLGFICLHDHDTYIYDHMIESMESFMSRKGILNILGKIKYIRNSYILNKLLKNYPESLSQLNIIDSLTINNGENIIKQLLAFDMLTFHNPERLIVLGIFTRCKMSNYIELLSKPDLLNIKN